MFKLFKKQTSQGEVSIETALVEPTLAERFRHINPMATNKNSSLVEEIHRAFYEEVDKLLQGASISKSKDTTKQDLINKCARLTALGFSATKEVRDAQSEIQRLNNIEKENQSNLHLTNVINYFSQKYPFYKFITEDSVRKICAKYGLVYSTIDNYIGTVPDENLKQMEAFKIKEEDELYNFKLYSGREGTRKMYNKVGDQRFCNDAQKVAAKHGESGEWSKNKLEIAAPLKDFNAQNLEVKNFQLTAKPPKEDPIVLCPVHYKNDGNKYYLIVTAWGDEASDALVVNKINN